MNISFQSLPQYFLIRSPTLRDCDLVQTGSWWHPLVSMCGASNEVVHGGIHWLACVVPVMKWFIMASTGWHLWCQWWTGSLWLLQVDICGASPKLVHGGIHWLAFVVPVTNWFIVWFTSGQLVYACFHHIWSRNLKHIKESTFKQCLCVMARKPTLLRMPSGIISGLNHH